MTKLPNTNTPNELLSNYAFPSLPVIITSDTPDGKIASIEKAMQEVAQDHLGMGGTVDIDMLEGAINSMTVKLKEPQETISRPVNMTKLALKLKNFMEKAEKMEIPEDDIKEVKILFHICDALAHNQEKIVPYLQPINDVDADGKAEVVKYEALVRLEKEGGGIFRPDEFLKVARKHGLNNKIAEITFEKALTIALQEETSVSLNFGTEELLDNNFLIWFVDNVTTKGLNPKKIGIEVLESVDMTDEYVIEALEFLREKGFTILVDDFGEEKANMKHVIAISPDVIKLDRKTMETIFATRIGEIKGGLDSEIIEVLEYTKENGCTIITEGIENNEQLITMQELAKEYAVKMLFQGYFLGRPVNPRELFKQKIPSPESIRLENIVTTNQYVA